MKKIILLALELTPESETKNDGLFPKLFRDEITKVTRNRLLARPSGPGSARWIILSDSSKVQKILTDRKFARGEHLRDHGTVGFARG